MFLSRAYVIGFRASAEAAIECEFPGRFSILLGANNAGKTTLADAIYLAHPHTFPHISRPSSEALSSATPREVAISYAFNDPDDPESALGRILQTRGLPAPRWTRALGRSLGRVRSSRVGSPPEGEDELRFIYLPAYRNPLDELARREARVLIELFRAENLRLNNSRNLAALRALASELLERLSREGLLQSVEERVRTHLSALSSGVSQQFAFVGGQVVDDEYLARVLELLLGSVDERALARRLEVSGLGYVNLLHIAVTLAGIPDPNDIGGPAGLGEVAPGSSPPAEADEGPPQEPEVDPIAQADAEAESLEDAFYPEQFHVTVLIEEAEAHLHPQLQHGLTRYLRQIVKARPELQIIMSSHSGETISAAQPEELVVLRKLRDGQRRGVAVKNLPIAARLRTLRMAKLHMDATRSASLFAERMILAEGITESVLLRQFGRAWAGEDSIRQRFIDALTITVMGTKIGRWPIDLLACPNYEIVNRLAVLMDTDKRDGTAFTGPAWLAGRDAAVVQGFYSVPTLEPAVTPGNEEAVRDALDNLEIVVPGPVSPENVDDAFRGAHKARKAEFALALANQVMGRLDLGLPVTVPDHFVRMFDFLFDHGDPIEPDAHPTPADD